MALCCLAQRYARVRAPKEEKVKESVKELHHLNIKDHHEVFVKEKNRGDKDRSACMRRGTAVGLTH
jgi:hypothetical protein